jgi:competence protein ComFC
MRRELLSKLRGGLEALASLVYPEVCQCCGQERAVPAQGYVGELCRKKVRPIRAPFCERCGRPCQGDITNVFECTNCRGVALHFTYARAAVAAGEVVRDVIHRYKYDRELWFEPFLVEYFLAAAVPILAGAQWDVVVPVPLHPTRQREREFNQAEKLARHLGAAMGWPINHRALIRTKATETQTHLSREERAENMRNAFAMRKGANVRGARVVLVDDVMTTGATTNACARVLRKAGAEEVCVWTVARSVLN